MTDTPSPRRFRKLPSHWLSVVMPLLLSVKMTFIVSGISTLKGIGFAEGFFHDWMTAWGLSWIVAFPVLLVMLPLVRRVASLVVEVPGMPSRRG